jgi:hypothetical protein
MIDRTQSSLSVEGKSKEADSLARKPSTDSDKDLRAVNVVTNVSEESKHSSGRQTYSFYVFSPDNAVRQVLGKLRGTTLYQLSMGATTLACALFVFLKPASKSVDVHAADVVFCVIFVFDVLSGTVAMGILKYWRHDIFHKIDFVTTLLYAVELALKTIGFTYRCLYWLLVQSHPYFSMIKNTVHTSLKNEDGFGTQAKILIRGWLRNASKNTHILITCTCAMSRSEFSYVLCI